MRSFPSTYFELTIATFLVLSGDMGDSVPQTYFLQMLRHGTGFLYVFEQGDSSVEAR